MPDAVLMDGKSEAFAVQPGFHRGDAEALLDKKI